MTFAIHRVAQTGTADIVIAQAGDFFAYLGQTVNYADISPHLFDVALCNDSGMEISRATGVGPGFQIKTDYRFASVKLRPNTSSANQRVFMIGTGVTVPPGIMDWACSGGMGALQTTVVVNASGGAPVNLVAGNRYRTVIAIYNPSGVDTILIGNDTVAAASGLRVSPGQSLVLTGPAAKSDLWAISTGAAITAQVTRLYDLISH